MLDYEALPPRIAAALFSGLRDDARIKMKLAGVEAGTDTLLRAVIADRLGLLVWSKTDDASRGRNKPTSFAEALTGAKNASGGVKAFRSAEAFEAARAKIVKEAAACQR